MQTFGAALTGTAANAENIFRQHRARAAFRGEAARRERLLTELRTARLTGIRVAVRSRRSRRACRACPQAGRARPISGAQEAVPSPWPRR